MTATIEDLSSVPLFAGLSDTELGHVLEITKEVRFASGTPVVETDKSGVGFHLITRGNADVYVGDDKVSTFGPGDYFGEMSMLDGKPRSATVVANGDLTTLSIPSWDFEQLLGRNPSIMRALLNVLSERIRRSEALRS
jgi:CRP/FNR family transcriptional regulator, cyclic AMP receptor protein